MKENRIANRIQYSPFIEKTFRNEILIHYDYFIKIAIGLTKNYTDAQDLVQDTYLRAYRFFRLFEPGSNSKAWLYRIMKNLFINYSRKKSAHAHSSMETIVYEPRADAYDENMTRSDIIKLMERIKDEYRVVITLFHLEEHSLDEISKILKWPLGTVKSRLHRARKEIRKVMIQSFV